MAEREGNTRRERDQIRECRRVYTATEDRRTAGHVFTRMIEGRSKHIRPPSARRPRASRRARQTTRQQCARRSRDASVSTSNHRSASGAACTASLSCVQRDSLACSDLTLAVNLY